ncbi:unnamed protein product, partial [Mesorhabditis spiculigera]
MATMAGDMSPIPYKERLIAFIIYVPLEAIMLSTNLLIVLAIAFIYDGTALWPLYKIAIACDYIIFKVGVLLVLFATVNTTTIFRFPHVNEKVFSGRSLHALLLAIWVLGVIETCIETFTDCPKGFRAKGNLEN